MAKQMKRIDLLEILDGLVAGELIEGISNNRDLEEQLLIGAALKQIGDEIAKIAREQALSRYRGTRGKQIEGRIIIEYRPENQQTRVDSAAVRTDLPPDKYPMYWKRINTRESIRVTIAERSPAALPATHR